MFLLSNPQILVSPIPTQASKEYGAQNDRCEWNHPKHQETSSHLWLQTYQISPSPRSPPVRTVRSVQASFTTGDGQWPMARAAVVHGLRLQMSLHVHDRLHCAEGISIHLMYIYIYINVCVCMYVCMYVCIKKYVYIYMCVYVYV